METFRVFESDGISRIGINYQNDVCHQLDTSDTHETMNLGNDIIIDFDSYMDEINDRLTISRMVSDSIIRGMVNAVSQEAAEVVGAKELEVARLKEMLRCQKFGNNEISISLRKHDEIQMQKHVSFSEEWKVELDICKEVEAMVFSTVVQGLQYEYERQVWDISNALTLIDRFNEISSLRDELKSIQKLFVGSEVGNLCSQGSIGMDHCHRKVLSNHSLPLSRPLNENGTCEESKVCLPENFETSSLTHMSAPELYQHFRTVITEMKRGHESDVQKMTDANFDLRRELLKEKELVKEKGPFAALKKDKDFEKLKKKIPEVISKLDDIVRDTEKLSDFCNHSRDTLDSLLAENRLLKDLLHGQKQERYRAEENFLKLFGDLKCALNDEHITAYFREEVYKCIIKEMDEQMNSSSGDLDMKPMTMQDVREPFNEGVFQAVDVASKSDSEDLTCFQSSIIQQIYGFIYEEAFGDMSMELTGLRDKCLKDNERLDFLQRKVSEIENELTRKVDENKELELQILVLKNSMEEKIKSLHEVTALLEKDKVQYSEEINELSRLRLHQEALISDRNEELVLLKGKMEAYQKRIDFLTPEVDKLNKALAFSKDELRRSDEEKIKFYSLLKLKQKDLESMKEKENKHLKDIESLCHDIQNLSKSFGDFDLRTKESIGWHNVRLENSAYQLHTLIPKVNVLRRTGSLYRERLEKKCSDLQKAEAEVDLLGDEVDALLSLLEKIYVALDHYSPILKHYPGIIEILELVKRELSGEAVKAAV